MGCPFCDLAKDQDRNRILRTNKLVTTFLSNPRLVPGHTLVIPNRHVEKPWELNQEELLAIFDEIKWAEGQILDGALGSGVDIRQHYRPFLPQGDIKIDHIHFHVLPRHFDDELFTKAQHLEVEMFQPMSDTERDKVTQIFK